MVDLSTQVLAQCVDDVQSGRATVQDCLAAHLEVAEDLRELLELTSALTPPPVSPDPVFRERGRAALLTAISRDGNRRSSSPIDRFWLPLVTALDPRQGAFGVRALRPVMAAVVLFALLGATAGGVVSAAQDALPGDTLYGVKLATESVQLALASSDEARARVHLELAAKRLAELDQVSARGQTGAINDTAQALADEVTQAVQDLTRAVASGRDVGDEVPQLVERLSRQQATLAAVEDRVAEPARGAVSRASRAAEQGLTVAGTLVGPSVARAAPPTASPSPATTAAANAVDSTPTPGRVESSPTATRDGGRVISGPVAVTLTQAISNVQQLASDPKVPGQSFDGLLAKLRAVQAALERGQESVAVQLLDAFLNEANALERSGHLSTAQYDALYASYHQLVSSLGGTPAGRLQPVRPTTEPGRRDSGVKPEQRPESAGSPASPATPPAADRSRPGRSEPPAGRPATSPAFPAETPSQGATPVVTETPHGRPTVRPPGAEPGDQEGAPGPAPGPGHEPNSPSEHPTAPSAAATPAAQSTRGPAQGGAPPAPAPKASPAPKPPAKPAQTAEPRGPATEQPHPPSSPPASGPASGGKPNPPASPKGQR